MRPLVSLDSKLCNLYFAVIMNATLTDFRKMEKKKLRELADKAYKAAVVSSGEAHIGYLLQAQLYTAELERRADSAVSIRDLLLEIVVILLIGGEILLGWQQGKDISTAFNEIEPILSALQTSSAATAGTLTALRGTTETMNGAIQKQVALFYDVELNIVYQEPSKTLMLINDGRTNVELWGARLGKGAVQMFPKPQIITPTGSYNQSLEEFHEALLRTLSKGTTEDVP